MALSTLKLTNYKNYYNRVSNEPLDGLGYDNYVLVIYPNINFNPGDGIYTKQVVNYDSSVYVSPTYVIVENGENEITSRWFIMEMNRTSAGQYELSLYRDTIADSWEALQDAPMFIEKGILPFDDPMIFNSENMTFNQIKTKETLLKDKTNIPWLIGYYARNFTAEQMKGTIARNDLASVGIININSPVEDWKYYNYTNLSPNQQTFGSEPNSIKYNTYGGEFTHIAPHYYKLTIDKNGAASSSSGGNSSHLQFDDPPYAATKLKQAYVNYGLTKLYNEAARYFSFVTPTEVQEFKNFNSKIIVDSEGKHYEITVNTKSGTTREEAVNSGSLFETMKTLTANAGISGTPGKGSFTATIQNSSYTMTLKARQDLDLSYAFTSERLITDDAPYDVFAIPYGAITVKDTSGTICTTTADIGIKTATSILQQNPGIVYDVQMLPYCPCQEWIAADGSIIMDNNYMYSKIADGSGKAYGVILNVPSSKFTFNINLAQPIIITEPKVQSECDMYRLVSPNYNGQFEFNAAKNGGIRYFNVDCFYKPFSPYIHVNPNFGGLYNRDFDDARGLICGGDFSLTSTTDRWAQYEINNKNYLNSFNRQIENMETQHKFQRINEYIGAGVGAVTGAASGALAGGMFGGPIGMGVGAAVGGIGSAVAGIGDAIINEQLRAETLDYTKDQFGYQLDNIQALPYSLNRVTALTANNKFFPFLEYYTCTDGEKQALRDKIKYNGMSVGRIGTLREFRGYSKTGYIKGKIIKLNLKEDDHYLQTIANELNKGIRGE